MNHNMNVLNAQSLLPPHVREYVQRLMQTLEQRPNHRLMPIERSDLLYSMLGPLDDPRTISLRGRLAIKTATKVLPIFEKGLPTEKMPHKLLNLAQCVVAGSLHGDTWRIRVYAEFAYHATGHDWGRDEDVVPINASWAGFSALKALHEARGQHYLQQFMRDLSQDSSIEPDRDITDDDISASAFSDTAGVAAIAYACDDQTSKTDPVKSFEFWKWWLLEALPLAWVENNRPGNATLS